MTKKRKWKEIFKGAIEDFDNQDSLKYWANKSAESKFKEVTRLIESAAAIKGWNLNERRLLRFTAVIKRP